MSSDVGNALYGVAVALGISGSGLISAVNLTPHPATSDFFVVRHIEAVRSGHSALITADRTIAAPIVMGFTVWVMQETPEGLTEYCTSEAPPFTYVPTAAPVTGKTLSWWTRGRCVDLPAGPVQIITDWIPADKRLSPVTNTVRLE